MADKLDYLQGVIDRLTFHSPETGYTVARLQSPAIKEPVTLVYGASAHRGQFCQYPGGTDPCPGGHMAFPSQVR